MHRDGVKVESRGRDLGCRGGLIQGRKLDGVVGVRDETTVSLERLYRQTPLPIITHRES